VNRLPARFAALDQDSAATLKTLRNKHLAHITDVPLPELQLGLLWALADRALTLGTEIQLIFAERGTLYGGNSRALQEDAARLVGHVRARSRRA
jgi:hypothetical protein